MINTNSLGILGQFYFNIRDSFKSIYQNSNFYEKKISKTFGNSFEYKPSPHLLSSIIKFQNKKYKIEDFAIESIWQNNLSPKDYEKLNNFFWFFSLDLKSSKKTTQTVIKNWISNNNKYQKKSWEFDLTAKRIISWLSNHQLTYEESDQAYRFTFDHMIQKQTNHLLNEIKNSKEIENKMIGCAAIILTGLAYKNEKQYLLNGLNLLKNIIKSSIDNQGFPKSRNIKQLVFYLKYFIIIREWFKESQSLIPEYIEETIYYLGSSYAFIWQNVKQDIFFNGNYSSDNNEFDQYLKRFGYTFKNQINELGGYTILKNKKIIIIGSSCGGWVGAKLIWKLKNIIGFIGISAAPDFTKYLMWNTFSKKAKQIISSGKVYKLKSDYDSYYPIGKSLIEGGKKNLILHLKKNCNFPLRFFHGLEDSVVPIEYSYKLSKTLYSKDSLILLQEKGDHSLSSSADLKRIGKELLEITKSRVN